MLLAVLAALLVLVTAVVVSLAGRLKSVGFRVEFEGRNLPTNHERNLDENKSLTEADEQKYLR